MTINNENIYSHSLLFVYNIIICFIFFGKYFKIIQICTYPILSNDIPFAKTLYITSICNIHTSISLLNIFYFNLF